MISAKFLFGEHFACRGKNRGKSSYDGGSWTNDMDNQPSGSTADSGDVNDESGIGKVGDPETEGAVLTLQDRLKWLDPPVVKKVGNILPSDGCYEIIINHVLIPDFC